VINICKSQTNTGGAEVLYQMVVDECKRQQQQQQQQGGGGGGVILDVCCGTGTIGICAAVQLSSSSSSSSSSSGQQQQEEEQQGGKEEKEGGMVTVLGVELCPTAVEDARANAARNGVGNAVFVCAKGGWVDRWLGGWRWIWGGSGGVGCGVWVVGWGGWGGVGWRWRWIWGGSGCVWVVVCPSVRENCVLDVEMLLLLLLLLGMWRIMMTVHTITEGLHRNLSPPPLPPPISFQLFFFCFFFLDHGPS
jgi:hypothetical protein